MIGKARLHILSERLSSLPRWQQVIGGLMLFLFVLVALTAAVHNLLIGMNFGMDYFVFWNAGRAAVVERVNPYSPEVTLSNQIGIYGHPADPGRDQMPFANPPYALLPMLPAVWMPFTWAQPYWLALNILLLITAVLVTFPQYKARAIATILFFYPFTFGLILGNYAVLIAGALLLYFGALIFQQHSSKGLQAAAGIFLAWATCKPQFVVFYVAVIVLFALRFRQRTFLVSFFTSLTAFLLLSFWIVPGWPAKWLAYLNYYADNNQTFPFAQKLLGLVLNPQSAEKLTPFFLGAALLLLAYLVLQWWRGRLPDLQLFAFVGLVTFLFHPQNVIAYEQLILWVPFILWALNPEIASRPAVKALWLIVIIISWIPFALRFAYPIDEGIWFGLILIWTLWLTWMKPVTKILQPAA